MAPEEASQDTEQPLFSVVKGSASEEEIAALTVAVMKQRQQSGSASKQPVNPLSEVGRLLSRRQRIGAGLPPGPGSWKRAKPR